MYGDRTACIMRGVMLSQAFGLDCMHHERNGVMIACTCCCPCARRVAQAARCATWTWLRAYMPWRRSCMSYGESHSNTWRPARRMLRHTAVLKARSACVQGHVKSLHVCIPVCMQPVGVQGQHINAKCRWQLARHAVSVCIVIL
eukprot:scaffold150169_cov20-Tisochrysis_lutea.AAC.1